MSGEEKQKKLERVAKSILSIVVRFGLENLSPSRLARAAHVSRPWVYKYIGGSKEALTSFAVDYFGKLLAQIDTAVKPARIDFFRDDEIARLEHALSFADKHPDVIALYYRYKGTPTSLGRAIENIENEYRRAKILQIKNTFKIPQSEAEVYTEILVTLKMGLCHKWVLGDLKGKITRENYLKVLSETFKKFFSEL